MSHALTRADRLQEMERLYLLRGYTDMELADRLGVDRTTVYRDRIELEGHIPIYQDADGRYRIDRSVYISHLRLNLAEALSLYLAARRAAQQTRLSHQHVASAIEKLSVALHQPMTERLVRAADTILAQRQDPGRGAVFAAVPRLGPKADASSSPTARCATASPVRIALSRICWSRRRGATGYT